MCEEMRRWEIEYRRDGHGADCCCRPRRSTADDATTTLCIPSTDPRTRVASSRETHAHPPSTTPSVAPMTPASCRRRCASSCTDSPSASRCCNDAPCSTRVWFPPPMTLLRCACCCGGAAQMDFLRTLTRTVVYMQVYVI